MAWIQPWFHRQHAHGTHTLAAAISRWSSAWRNRRGRSCTVLTTNSPHADSHDVAIQRVMLSLAHHLEVSRATQYLLHHLDCDGWHVACRHEHQVVVQLTRGGVARYGVTYDCTPDVEKAAYHGSRTWALTIIPLHGNDNLPAAKVEEIKAGLGHLHG